MRIRKNKSLTRPLEILVEALGPQALQPYICGLNQSRWDVTPLSELNKFGEEERDDSAGKNENLDALGTNGAVGRIKDDATIIIIDDDDDDDDDVNDGDSRDGERRNNITKRNYLDDKNQTRYCFVSKDKEKQCENEIKNDKYLCDYHLSLLKSYNDNKANNNNSLSVDDYRHRVFNPPSKKCRSGRTRAPSVARPRGSAPMKKEQPSDNGTNGFYWYSGFGPRWARKRGDTIGNIEQVPVQDISD